MNCIECTTELNGRQTKFCSSKCKNRFFQSTQRQLQKGLDIKINMVIKKGGGCQQCGYNKNFSALCFHHRDPSTKDFTIDMNTLSNRSIVKVQLEVDKCDLLCHNCHMELHHPNYNRELVLRQ